MKRLFVVLLLVMMCGCASNKDINTELDSLLSDTSKIVSNHPDNSLKYYDYYLPSKYTNTSSLRKYFEIIDWNDLVTQFTSLVQLFDDIAETLFANFASNLSNSDGSTSMPTAILYFVSAALLLSFLYVYLLTCGLLEYIHFHCHHFLILINNILPHQHYPFLIKA